MIQSVDRALDIMTYVSNNRGIPVTISDISKNTNINASTCCHIVDTLVHRGFLNKVSRSSGYVLGVYSYNLTRYKDFHRDLILNTMPILRWLQNKTGYTTVLANLIEGDKFVLCYSDNPDNPLNQKGDIYKGTLYDSATGRAMLSELSDSELKKVVKKVGLPKKDEWPDIDSYTQLKNQLSTLKKAKIFKVISIDEDKYICKFGVSFVGNKSQIFAIGIDMHKNSKPIKKEIDSIEKLLLTAVQEVNRRMNFDKI